MMRNKRFIIPLAAAITVSASMEAATADTLRMSVGEVVVTGTRDAADTRHLPMTVSVVDRKALTGDYRLSVLPTVAEQVPGMFVTTRGILGYGVSSGAAGTMKVRGVGGGAAMLVLIDGQPQYAGLYGHPIADAYQTMTAERVEVVRGPASLLYGSNAMGGVMNIVTRRMATDGVRSAIRLGGGSYGTAEGEITNRVRAGKFSSNVGLTYGRTDGHRANSAFEQYSGFAKLGYDLGKHWAASGDINITHFENSNPGMADAPMTDNDMRITRGMASVALANDYDGTSGAIRAYYSWGHHNIDDGYRTGGTPRTSLYMHDDIMAGVSVYQSVELFKGNRLTLGADFQHFGGEAWNRPKAGGESSSLADNTENEVAAYMDFRQDLTAWLTVDAGIRVDHHSVAGTEWVPQGGITVRISSHDDLRAMVSKGFRNPTIKEMYMFNPKNPELRPESMVNHEIAYTRRLMEGRMRLGLNVFYLKAKNLINTVRIEGKPLNMNTGRTENSGAEAEIAFMATPQLNVNANYSYLHTSAHITGAPRHKLYAGADYTIGRLSLNTGLQYFARLMTDENSGSRSHAALLHITASWKAAAGLRIYARGENLLAQRYETYKGFPMPRATFAGGVNWEF